MSVNVFICMTCLKLLLGSNVAGEWVDMPQFSSEKKIYRIPPAKKDHFYKFNEGHMETYFPYGQREDYPGIIIRAHDQFNENTTQIRMAGSKTNTESSISVFDTSNKEEVGFTDDNNKIPSNVLIDNTSQSNYEEANAEVSTDEPVLVNQDKHNDEFSETKKPEIIEYLPLELLKNVHKILKSQSMSPERKVQFLKRFEQTLMVEIDSRLAMTMRENRRKRGVSEHYDHGSDDHDEHSVGFPSIEGALMAISFLTFAVYLVRLVMLLFRNMNNTTVPTTGPTLLVGRRKRSLDQFEDTTAKILSDIDGFVQNYT